MFRTTPKRAISITSIATVALVLPVAGMAFVPTAASIGAINCANTYFFTFSSWITPNPGSGSADVGAINACAPGGIQPGETTATWYGTCHQFTVVFASGTPMTFTRLAPGAWQAEGGFSFWHGDGAFVSNDAETCDVRSGTAVMYWRG